VRELLDLVEKFEQESESIAPTITDFTGFLVNHLEGQEDAATTPDVRFGEEEQQAQQMAYQLDNSIARLFIYMSRYAKFYIKKALEGTALRSAEDFTGLAILLTHESLSRSELISRNLQEKPSGTEVITRLLEAGLIWQWDDENDKRTKRVAITSEGKELLYRVFQDMNQVSKMVTGSLSAAEKFTLRYLLQKLENFHYHHHELKTIKSKTDLNKHAGKLV
jgi:DNA-binding MarR family transcriptional regulator